MPFPLHPPISFGKSKVTVHPVSIRAAAILPHTKISIAPLFEWKGLWGFWDLLLSLFFSWFIGCWLVIVIGLDFWSSISDSISFFLPHPYSLVSSCLWRLQRKKRKKGGEKRYLWNFNFISHGNSVARNVFLNNFLFVGTVPFFARASLHFLSGASGSFCIF